MNPGAAGQGVGRGGDRDFPLQIFYARGRGIQIANKRPSCPPLFGVRAARRRFGSVVEPRNNIRPPDGQSRARGTICKRALFEARYNFDPGRNAINMKSRIMYIEDKSGGVVGPARIGRVTFSKTGRTIYYRGRSFRSLKGAGFKANYYDVETGDHFWISGPKRDGGDALYASNVPIEIDDDVREEYWREIRGPPEKGS
jgi:hypothetical protein